ncbi:MAG TPA: hypothetical protein DEQ03_10750, partial [Marinilabiliales bacterium]|nr:hypothetical protein [Marinilabiliales bacterium]
MMGKMFSLVTPIFPFCISLKFNVLNFYRRQFSNLMPSLPIGQSVTKGNPKRQNDSCFLKSASHLGNR